jgi:diguanylate cyclase
MSPVDSMEKSKEYLRMALQHMGRYGIPMTPMNYAVWYEYVSGTNGKLKASIDRIRESDQTFTPELNLELYKRFITNELLVFRDLVNRDIQNIFSEMLESINETGVDLSRFTNDLQTFTRNLLDSAADAVVLRKLADDMIIDTQQMEDSSELLKNSLEDTRKEVEELRKKLQESKTEAYTDALTGIANRRCFDERLQLETQQVKSSGETLCLMMADIDFFKTINDNYGHLVGDNVLRMISTTIKDFIKGKDFLARYGGEEFVVLLPDTPLKGALNLAEKVRCFFEQMRWKEKGSGKSIGSVTLSFGVSCYRPEEPIADFLHRADLALYRSKQNGRNQVSSEDQL